MRTILMAIGFLAAVNAAWIALLMFSYHREEQAARMSIRQPETIQVMAN